ncbi:MULTISPECIES: transposase zinc-binding domain-containing protein [unclassified Thiocapsa]|uniref:transposase zinc-binding domain-containing protein n=1 Tax=unclassified Thiocapsa TaxID=2641286 RepID=UPI0035B4A58D
MSSQASCDGQRVPAYVEREFRRYLECGILAYAFARTRCPDCGRHFLVAFSCNRRGVFAQSRMTPMYPKLSAYDGSRGGSGSTSGRQVSTRAGGGRPRHHPR